LDGGAYPVRFTPGRETFWFSKWEKEKKVLKKEKRDHITFLKFKRGRPERETLQWGGKIQ